ncbi:uncharacterized, partial [Tachysurus ichikawai]
MECNRVDASSTRGHMIQTASSCQKHAWLKRLGMKAEVPPACLGVELR